MNLKNRIIIEDYRKYRKDYLELDKIVNDKLNEIIANGGIQILEIEHRVKQERSLAGKLERSGDWYQSLSELTDLVGTRIICYFNDEVERIGSEIEKEFDIDWEFSADKKELLNVNSFGYRSLHYTCTLKAEKGYPENVCNKYFEIQIRTNLQHTWSAIEHDLGYKSEFGVPKVVVREFARLAGLLELADDEFIRIRNNVKNYTEEIRNKIINNCADDVAIDMISLQEYMDKNKRMKEFLDELASFSNAEIQRVLPDNYIEQLSWFGMTTLGQLQNMLDEDYDIAIKLAENALRHSDLDILSSTVGLRYLCRAQLYTHGYTQEQAEEFFVLSTGNKERAKRQAKQAFESFKRL